MTRTRTLDLDILHRLGPALALFAALSAPTAVSTARAGELLVRVADEAGRPVSPARVWAVGGEAADVDAAGSRSFADAPTGVCATAPGRRLVLAFPTPGEARLDVVLPPGAELAGIVRTAAPPGAPASTPVVPLAGAHVAVDDGDVATCVGAATTGADGRFAIGGLAPGRVGLDVSADGHRPRSLEVGGLARRSRDVEVALHAEVAVSGIVRAAGGPTNDTGTRDAQHSTATTATTAHHGEADASAALPVQGGAAGDFATVAPGGTPRQAATGSAAKARPGASAAPAPLPGATVTLGDAWKALAFDPPLDAGERRRLEELSLVTGPDGRFALPPLPRAATWRLVVRHPDLAPASATLSGFAPSAGAEATLGPGATVTLTARDASGVPWPAPRVRLFGSDVKDLDLLSDLPPGGADGRLALARLVPGRVSVELRASGARPRLLRNVVLRDGATTDLGEVVLAPGVTLAGRVEEESGAPIAGARVRLRTTAEGHDVTLHEVTDETGTFAFEGLDPQLTVRVDAEADRHLSRGRRDVDPVSGEELVLVLPRAGSLVLLVTDALTGEPVPGAAATARPRAGGAPRDAKAEGDRIALADLALGRWDVRVRSPRHRPAVLEDVTVETADGDPIEVRLEPGWVLEGRVVAAENGRPVAGASVQPRFGWGGGESVSTDLDGGFMLEGLDGAVSVRASDEERQPATAGPFEAGSPRVTIELALGGAVEGLVLGPGGLPRAGAEISAEHTDRRTRADVEGRYRLAGLAEGLATLIAVDVAGTYRGYEQAAVTIVPGQVTRHDFGLGARISGRVTSGDDPAPGARLGLLAAPVMPQGAPLVPDSLQARATESDEDGRYALTGIEPGPATITVRWNGHRFAIEVDVPEGVTEVPLDIAIPELVLEGRVLHAETGEPMPGIKVVASPHATFPEGMTRPSFERSMATETDEMQLATRPSSSQVSRSDGGFALLLPQPGAWRVWVAAAGYRLASHRETLEVTVSRSDLVLEVAPEPRRTTVLVRLTDASTGERIVRGVAKLFTEHGRTMSDFTDTAQMQTEPGRVQIVGWTEGRAPTVLLDVEIPDQDEPFDIDIPLDQGGDLLIVAPAGAIVRAGGPEGFSGLRLWNGSYDLLGVAGPELARSAEQVAEDEWLLHGVPAGRWEVAVGDGDGARTSVDVVAGDVAVADLR